MTVADLLLLALFLLFALFSWLGAALHRRRARQGASQKALSEVPRGAARAPRPRRAAPLFADRPPVPPAPTGAPKDGAAPRAARCPAPRRTAELARALRHRGSLRTAVVLAAILDRRPAGDG